MLEEVQVAHLLDLGVANRVFRRDLWMGKTSTSRRRRPWSQRDCQRDGSTQE
jgi:hypothetical protein